MAPFELSYIASNVRWPRPMDDANHLVLENEIPQRELWDSCLVQTCSLVAVYLLVSTFGSLFSVPPGYLSTVWPASGIALGWLLIYGIRLWPGVLLGSVLANVLTSYDPSGSVSLLEAMPIFFAIGIGAAMQAVLGTVLINRFVGFPSALHSDREAVLFLLLGGPIACILNATWGNLTLVLSGAASVDGFVFAWWTWWVDETVGVLVFTPLVLIALAKPRAVWRPRAMTIGLPLLLGFIVAEAMLYSSASNSWAIPTGTLLFIGLLSVLLFVIDGRTAKIEQLVEQRISVQNRIDEERRESEARLQAVFDNTPVCLNLKDREGRYILLNGPYEKWLGHSSEEVIGKKASEFLGNQGEVENIDASERLVLETGETVEREVRVIGRDNKRYDRIVIKFPVMSAEGSVTAIGTIAVDITEQKQVERQLRSAQSDLEVRVEERTKALLESEERYRFAFENAPVAMALITPEGKRFQVNQALADFLGHSMAELTDTDMTTTAGDMGDLDKSLQLRQQVLDGDISTYRNERRYRRKDGRIIWGEVYGSLFRGQNGDPEHFIAHTIDITDRKNVEAALKSAKAEAEKANRAKSEFLASMSHELRTPLNAILGFAEILGQQYFGPIGEKYQEYAIDIQSSGKYLLGLVNEILDLSAIEAGKQSLAKELIPSDMIISESIKIIEPKAQSAKIELVTNMPNVPPVIYADKRATKQVLINLLTNAIKFTPKGGEVAVSVKSSTQNTIIKVSDTGNGISSEKLPGLTDPFTRAVGDPYLAEKGWGLGLSISKSLIELHDGNMEIQSDIGIGTTVTVTLPNEAA